MQSLINVKPPPPTMVRHLVTRGTMALVTVHQTSVVVFEEEEVGLFNTLL